MNATPHMIGILLHHHVNPNPWPLGLTSAYLADTVVLHGDGILLPTPEGFEVTEKGRAWIAAILSTPYPTRETVWFDAAGNKLEVR